MIFNKNNNGTEELKDLLGFISSSIEFDNIKNFVPLAERDLIPIISKAVYKLADEHYNSELYKTPVDDDEEQEEGRLILDELVYLTQIPTALHAYRRYVPSGDLTHSDAGRQMHVNDNEKPAWEWMIDKDDLNMLNLAYEHTEVLLDFLNVNAIEAWTESDQYKASKKLFINTTEAFNNILFIDNSPRVFFALVPIMKEVENNILKSCFTDAKWTEIKEAMESDEDNAISADNQKLIDLAVAPVAFFTIARAVKRFNLQFLPEGIFQLEKTGVINTKKTASIMDKHQASVYYFREGNDSLAKLQKEIAKQNNSASASTDPVANLTDRMSADNKFLRF